MYFHFKSALRFTPEAGFLGKLTVYTVEGTVRYDKREIITDNGWMEEDKQQYLQNLEELEKWELMLVGIIASSG